MDQDFECLERVGLLPFVLGKLESIDDIIRCSAVSRHWNSTSKQVRLVQLVIGDPATQQLRKPMSRSALDLSDLAAICLWLISARAGGMLQNLQGFSVSTPDRSIGNSLQSFDRVCLDSVSMSPLKTCSMQSRTGSIVNATTSLPHSLQSISLKLCPSGLSGIAHTTVSLEMFDKFTLMTSMELDWIWELQCEHVGGVQYILNGNSLLQLDALKLQEGVLCIPQGLNVQHSLRNLRHLSVSMHVGHQAVQSLLDLPTLQVLDLQLLPNIVLLYQEKVYIYLYVKHTSLLCTMSLTVPELDCTEGVVLGHQHVFLNNAKPELDLECSGPYVTSM